MKTATILDVARVARVGKSTVSRVMTGQNHVSPAARVRVERAVQRLNFQPNRLAGGLRSKRTHTIGLVIPDISNPFFSEVALGVQQAADELGFAMLLANTAWSATHEEANIALAQRNRLDGLIINPIHIAPEALTALGRPVLVLGTREGYGSFDNIGSDTPAAMRLALAHLASLGHVHVCCMPGPRNSISTRIRTRPVRAFQRQCAAGMRITMLHCDFTQRSGMAAASSLMQLRPVPTAVLCGNDLMAVGILAGLRALGVQVPKDMSVMGIDDIELASVCHPALTTVRKVKRELGAYAAKTLIERIESGGARPPQAIHLPSQLIVRESTAPPAIGSIPVPGGTDLAEQPYKIRGEK